MTINKDEVRLIYKGILFDKKPSDRKNCPSIKNIIRLYRGEYLFNKNNVLSHLENCFYCAQEVQLISSIVSEEKKLLDNLPSSKSENIKNSIFTNLFFKSHYLFSKYKTVSIGFIIFLIVSLFFLYKYPINTHLRSFNSNPNIIIESHKIKITNYSIELNWKEINNSKYYIVDVFDNGLAPFWKSTEIYDTYISLPIEVINSMQKGNAYYYIITCYLTDGRHIESQIEKFILKSQ